ncbi:MAG TPA: hypothetical protein PLF27_07530 [Sedimentibacter sp.]|nr:hypothetical protein [Sedimentibacter sp.]
MLTKLEVGQLLQNGITSYQEGIRFDFHQSGPILYLYFSRPKEKEIESIKSGKFDFGFYFKDEIIFILAKFQGMPWMDAPYSVHQSQPFTFQDIQDGKGFGLTTLLTDADTGILKVIRYSGLSTIFSKRFKDAIDTQKNMPFDKEIYCKKINAIYGNYKTKDLVTRADAIDKIKG